MIYEGQKDIFRPSVGVIKDDYLYFVLACKNLFCKISLVSGEMSLVKELDDEEGDALHLVSEYDESRFALIPHSSKVLIILDKNGNEFQRTSIPNPERVNYNRFYIYGSKAYMLPIFRKDIAVVDLKSGEVSFVKLPVEKMNAYMDVSKNYGVVSSYSINERLFLLLSNPNLMVEYNCRENEFTIREDLKDCMSMCFGEGHFWLGKHDKTIVRYKDSNLKNGEKISLPKDFAATDILPLSSCRVVGDRAVFWSYNANMILRVDMKSGECDSLNLPGEDYRNVGDNSRSGPAFIAINNNTILFYSDRTGELILSDVEKNTYRTLIIYPNEDLLRTVKDTEIESINLKSFLKLI